MPNNSEGAPANATETGARPWWIGIAVILIGALWVYGGLSLPQSSRYAAVGPGMFVTMIGIVLIVLGIILLTQIARGEKFEPQSEEDAAGDAKADPKALGLALAAAVLPIFLIQWLGLPITAMISFALVARAFGSRRSLLDLLYGALLGSAAWLLFTELGLQLGGFLPIAGI